MPQKRKPQYPSVFLLVQTVETAVLQSDGGSANFAINFCCQKTLQPRSIIGNYVQLKTFSLPHYLNILLIHKQLILPITWDLE